MGEEWFYAKDGQQAVGPISAAQLKQLAAGGQVRPSDLVWKQGMMQWAPAGQVKGLLGSSPELRAAPPAPKQPEPATPRAAEPVSPSALNRIEPSPKVSDSFLRAGAEPWYYAFLERFTPLAMILGFVLVGLSAVLLAFEVYYFISQSAYVQGLFVLTIGVVGLALMALVIRFVGALVLLALDAARALRTGAFALLAFDASRTLRDIRKSEPARE